MLIALLHQAVFRTLQLARASTRIAPFVVVAAACGGSTATVAQPAPDEVAIRRFAFSPSPRTVPTGTTVTWKNHDGDAHTVSGDEGPEIWESGSLGRNATFSRTFGVPGTYRYSCSIHPEMRGSIVVGEVASRQADEGTATLVALGNIVSDSESRPAMAHGVTPSRD